MTNWPIASSMWTRLPARRAIPRKEELIEGAVKKRCRIANNIFSTKINLCVRLQVKLFSSNSSTYFEVKKNSHVHGEPEIVKIVIPLASLLWAAEI